MPSQWALLQARKAAIRTMPDLVEISRPTFTSDSSGGQTATYATVRSTPGRISGIGGLRSEEAMMADRLGLSRAVIITLPSDITVLAKDRLVSGGRTYDVAAHDVGRSDPVVRRVLVNEVL